MSYSPTVPGRMNAIKPLHGFTLAVPTAVPASADEAVAEAAVPAGGLLVARFPELHAVRVISTQIAPIAAGQPMPEAMIVAGEPATAFPGPLGDAAQLQHGLVFFTDCDSDKGAERAAVAALPGRTAGFAKPLSGRTWTSATTAPIMRHMTRASW
jgi:hypothetical protein